MLDLLADDAAQYGIDVAAFEQHAADQRVVGTQALLGNLGRDALAAAQVVVFLPEFLVARIGIGIHHLEIASDRQSQAGTFDAVLDHIRAPADQRFRQALVEHRLHGA